MNVVVAGGTGFLGRHVVAALRARGHSVLVLARGTRGGPEGVEVVSCDVSRDPLPVRRFRGWDALINLVGIKRERGTQTFESAHVGATRRLTAACLEAGIRRYVHVSVVCARPDADSGYHDTKWRAEQVVRESGLQRVAVRIMDGLMRAPLSTPSQLRMLVDGLYGDPEPARRELGLVPRPFTAEAVRAVEDGIGPLFGFSLRLADSREHARWLQRYRGAFAAALALTAGAVALQAALRAAVPNVWYRLAAIGALLSAFALARVDVGWRELFRPRLRHLWLGLGSAAVLYAAGWVVTRLLAAWPVFTAQVRAVYAWKGLVPGELALPLLLLIVLAEEIVWRCAVTLPLAARLGPLRGTIAAAAAFAAAHIPLGVPVLLLAALGAGWLWSALVVKTRSAVPALVAHVAWDTSVLFWLPYPSSG